MWLLPAFAAPVIMFLALSVQRRLGSEAAGLVGALPMTMPVAVLAVALSLGDPGASAFSLAAASHIPAQVAFGVAFALAMLRFGPIPGAAIGVLVFAAGSALLALVPAPVAVGLAVPALLVGPRVLANGVRRDCTSSGEVDGRPGFVTSCLTAGIAVALVLVAVRVAGPGFGGLFAALPMVSGTLAFMLGRSSGRAAGAGALAGMLRSLPIYSVFVVSVALLAEPVGTPVAVAVGLALSLGMAALVLALARRSRTAPAGTAAASLVVD